MTIIIGLMCLVLTLVMFMQFRAVREADITDIKNKREDELKEDLASWKTKYEETKQQLEETTSKISEYKSKSEANQEASELLDQELEQNNLLLGNTDVQGEGVIITLQDGESLVEAFDLLKLVNELKLAGAEAISINDKRIVNLTEIVDADAYIYVNMERTSSPFTIKVIGNQKYLESGLTAKNGFADKMMDEGKRIVVTGQKNVQIYKYDKELKVNSINIK